MIVIAIVGILAALTIGGLNGLSRRAEVNNFLGTFASDVTNARWVAGRRGCSVVFVVHQNDDQLEYQVFAEPGTNRIDINNLTVFPPAVAGVERLERRVTTKTVLADTRPTWGFGDLAFPFRGVYDSLGSGTLGCSFCQDVGGDQLGAFRILQDGQLILPSAAASANGAFLFASSRIDGVQRTGAAGVLAPSAMVRVFTY